MAVLLFRIRYTYSLVCSSHQLKCPIMSITLPRYLSFKSSSRCHELRIEENNFSGLAVITLLQNNILEELLKELGKEMPKIRSCGVLVICIGVD